MHAEFQKPTLLFSGLKETWHSRSLDALFQSYVMAYHDVGAAKPDVFSGMFVCSWPDFCRGSMT